MKKYLGFAIAMMALAQQPIREELKTLNQPKEPRKIIPKGCKTYKFYYGITQNVFECVAASEVSAKKKFKKFLNNLEKP